MDTATSENKYVVLTQEFDAPPELLWKCWTEPEHLRAWFGPDAFDILECTIDLRPGGRSFLHMRGNTGEIKGQNICCGMKYEQIVPNRRLVMEGYFADLDGNEVPASYYGNAIWPEKVEIILDLEPGAGGTQMTLTETVLPGVNQEQNLQEFFRKLEAHLQSLQA